MSILDYVFRELAISYLGRNDLAHVDQSDFSNTALGRGISEGKTDAVSKGLTRGSSLKVVSKANSDPKRSAGSGPSGPARSAPTAFSGSNVLALAPAIAERQEEATAYRRDYEERAKELAEDAAFEESADEASADLFTDAAAQEAAAAKALAATRRSQALMQGYTGNECSECHNFTMVRNGTCEKCDTCGNTSGCS